MEVGGAVASRRAGPAERLDVAARGLQCRPPADRSRGRTGGRPGRAAVRARGRRPAADPATSRSASAPMPVIAKIEKPQAIEDIEDIIQASDGIMVARGDLGVEMPIEQVPIIQKELVRRRQARAQAGDHRDADARVHGRVDPADPCRGERRGQRDLRRHRRGDAVQETAIGHDPVGAVRDDGRDRRATERELPYGRMLSRPRPWTKRGRRRHGRVRGGGRRLPAGAEGAGARRR